MKEEISSTRKYYTSARTTLGLWTDEAGGRKGRKEGKRVGLGRKGGQWRLRTKGLVNYRRAGGRKSL